VNLIQNGRLHQRNPAPVATRRALGLITPVLALLVLWWSLPGSSQVASPEQLHGGEPNQVLGSLSTAGEVYVNDSRAVPESTVFSGDRVRTGPTGAATFSAGGRATVKVFPQSRVLFSGNDQFTAELEAGTVVLSTVTGGSGMFLRMGDSVLVPSFPREQSTTSRAERAADGSFTVSCLEGSVGVLALKDRSGEFLHGGQSLRVSSNKFAAGELALVFSSKSMPKAPFQVLSPERLAIGGAGAGGVAFLVDRLIQSRSNPSVSPSTP
jgi:hypothetical protein